MNLVTINIDRGNAINKIFVVRRSCMTDVGVTLTDLRVVVQHNHVSGSAFTKMAGHNLLQIVKAAAGLDTLHCRLREGYHCGRLPSH